MKKRIGPKMALAVAYVAAHPGCTILAVADHVTPLPRGAESKNRGHGYNPVHRAIKAGLVKNAPPVGAVKGRYYLYAV